MTGSELPLEGRRILVTRAREQAEGLVDRLHALGATVVVVPLIATVPIVAPDEIARVAAEIRAAPEPRWVAFTSATAVRLVLGAAGTGSLSGMHVAAVGPATAAALEAEGVTPDITAVDSDASGLAAALSARGLAGATVWFPSAEGASDRLTAGLRAGGATVRLHQIYRTVMPDAAQGRLSAALRDGVDAITLTSGSASRHLVSALGGQALPPGVLIVCIGEQTASAARDAGLPVHAVAAEPSAAGLAAAVTGHLAPQPLR
jgi:uroporphyrinogen-III synthase